MPEGFSFGGAVDLWRPVLLVELPIRQTLRSWRYDGMIARLRPGRTIEASRAELTAICETLARDYPRSNAGWTVTVESLHASVIGDFGRATWMLLASVAVVLIVTCLNVGGLLTARAVARQRETAVRVALGASSWRLLRLSLCEASVLGVVRRRGRPSARMVGRRRAEGRGPARHPARGRHPDRCGGPGHYGRSRRCSACSSSPRHRPGGLARHQCASTVISGARGGRDSHFPRGARRRAVRGRDHAGRAGAAVDPQLSAAHSRSSSDGRPIASSA